MPTSLIKRLLYQLFSKTGTKILVRIWHKRIHRGHQVPSCRISYISSQHLPLLSLSSPGALIADIFGLHVSGMVNCRVEVCTDIDGVAEIEVCTDDDVDATDIVSSSIL